MLGFKVALQFDCQRNVREAQNQIHQPLFGLIELAQGLRVEIRQCVGNLSDHRVVEAEAGDVVADVAAMCDAGSGEGTPELNAPRQANKYRTAGTAERTDK